MFLLCYVEVVQVGLLRLRNEGDESYDKSSSWSLKANPELNGMERVTLFYGHTIQSPLWYQSLKYNLNIKSTNAFH